MFPSVSCVRVLNVTCMLPCVHRVQLCVTQWTAAPQASLSMGFFRQESQSGLPCPPPGDLPNPGIKPVSPELPALQVDSLLQSPWGVPCIPQQRSKIPHATTQHSQISKYFFEKKNCEHIPDHCLL